MLDPLALAQLAAWERIALDHPLREDPEGHLRCVQCNGTVFVLHDDKAGYLVTLGILQAALVAHLRNVHRDLDPNGRDNGAREKPDAVPRA